MDRRDRRKRKRGVEAGTGGEAEKPEATAPWSGVKSISVNPEGKSRHGQAQAKMTRKERKIQTKMEDSGGIQRNARLCVSCQARAFHEGLCFNVTVAAVTKRSDSGSLLLWWSMMVRRSTPSICVSNVATKV